MVTKVNEVSILLFSKSFFAFEFWRVVNIVISLMNQIYKLPT